MEDVLPLHSYRAILDAIPLIVLVVDDDVRVVDMNSAARKAFGPPSPGANDRRGGEVLKCIHSHDVPGGCGRGPRCKMCVIRSSVDLSTKGRTISRKRTRATIKDGDKTVNTELLVTTSPFRWDGVDYALLILEDVTELSRLRDLIPICSSCKRIRDDEQYWHEVDKYFSEQVGADFTHSICPSCLNRLYPHLAARMPDSVVVERVQPEADTVYDLLCPRQCTLNDR